MATGVFLDHISKHSPNLVSLIVQYSKILGRIPCCASCFSHSKITNLSLVYVQLYQPILLDLSERCPSLNTLLLRSCSFIDGITEHDDDLCYIVIDMPFTSFKTLTINCDNYNDDYIQLLIKLSILDDTRFYQYKCNTRDPSDNKYYDLTETYEQMYINDLDDDNRAKNIDIRCRAITTLKISNGNIRCKLTKEEYNTGTSFTKSPFVQKKLCSYFQTQYH